MQEGKLDAHIDEGGTNFSAGQRQLICLGVRLIDRLEDQPPSLSADMPLPAARLAPPQQDPCTRRGDRSREWRTSYEYWTMELTLIVVKVDVESDRDIQTVIRREFSTCTM